MPATTRARQDWQKEERAQAILNAAEALFEETGGHLSAVSEVAKRANIAKGTVYLYYETKEEIYFALLQRHMANWVGSVMHALQATRDARDVETLTDIFLAYILERPVMMELASLSHSVLEQNISEEAAGRYMAGFAALLDKVGSAIADKLPSVTPQTGADLCIQTYALLIGLWQISASPDACSHAMTSGDFKNITVDFERQVRTSLRALWSGIT